MKTFKKIAD